MRSVEKSEGCSSGKWIFFALTLAVFTSMDRSVLSLARGRIAGDLHLSDVQMGLVFGAFTVAYALAEIPSGVSGDRSGPEGVMTRVALWWSVFMAATGRVAGFTSLYVSQLLFGGGAAGVYPSIARTFQSHLSPRERSGAQGMIWLGSRWGGASTPILMAILFRFMDWRMSFTLLSLIGVIWAVGFRTVLPKGPASAADAQGPRAPWALLVRSPTVWLLCGQYFALVFPWFFFVTWMPTFMDERFPSSAGSSAIMKMLPLLFGGIGALASGLAAGPLRRRLGSAGRARKWLAILGCMGASMCLIFASRQTAAFAGVAGIALSSFSNDVVVPSAWGTAASVAGRWAGTVSAVMNMVGNMGGAIFGLVSGVMLETTHHDWNVLLWMNAGSYLAGALCWMLLDADKPIAEPDGLSSHPVPEIE